MARQGVSKRVPKRVPKQRVRVLGVDPGLTRCGLGVVDGPPSSPTAVSAGCVSTESSLPLEKRLRQLHAAVDEDLRRHEPDVVACERVLFSANARTAMAVGQAAGVVLLAAANHDIPVASYSPNDVKLTVAGHGAADKHAVARMVTAQLHLDERPRPADVTDALAVALCHLARMRAAGEHTVGSTPASDQLAAAAAAADRDGAGGWEAVLDRQHVREATGPAARGSVGISGRSTPSQPGDGQPENTGPRYGDPQR